jgi:hypothetical protein
MNLWVAAWISIIIAVCILLVLALASEQRQWDDFVKQHHCKVTQRMSGETFTTINANGTVGFGATDDKTGWLCDDGVTYWK